jgi:hypothetical protein
MRSDLEKRLMNIATVFVNLGPWATDPAIFVVKLEFGK